MHVLAHRGARREAPENTLEAFRRARVLGADGVELDVHLAVDGALVVFHDAAAPGVGVLATRTLEDIRQALPAVPTLEEALDTCAGLLVNVEIKNSVGDADHDPTCRQADAVGALLDARRRVGTIDDVIVSSFHPQTIARVRALEPGRPTGLLSFGVDPFETLALAAAGGHAAVHPDAWSLLAVRSSLVERAHQAGLAVNTWTVNEPEVVRELAAAGVDGVITDVPDVTLRALGREPVPPA